MELSKELDAVLEKPGMIFGAKIKIALIARRRTIMRADMIIMIREGFFLMSMVGSSS